MRRLVVVGLLGATGCDRVFGSDFPAAPDALPAGDWIAIESGKRTTCGLRDGGSLWCWGNDETGALGVGDLVERTVPTRVGADTWATISAKHRHACAIRQSDRTLWCWGANEAGQLGIGIVGPEPQSSPVMVGIDRWESVAVGHSHTCGLREGGVAYCWGSNANQQLGTGNIDGSPTPIPVYGTSPYRAITVGERHSCGIQIDNTLWCWGNNERGQMAEVPSSNPYGIPKPIGTATWATVSAGGDSTCGILQDGKLRCWGLNERGQLGIGTTTDQYMPTAVGNDTGDWTQIRLGYDHACGIRGDGELWCWGDNEHTQIPNVDATPIASTPVRIVDGAARWATVAPGARHTCGIGSDGNLWCAGNRGSGQLGTGAGSHTRPTAVAGGLRATEIAATPTTTCIVDDASGMHCWGSDRAGSLGSEARGPTDRPRAVVVPAGSAWAGLSGGFEDVYCALHGSRRGCWGVGDNGQHGVISLEHHAVPFEDAEMDWMVVAVGWKHTCGIEATLRVPHCWGRNTHGQIADPSRGADPPRSDEGARIGNLFNYRSISAGELHTCAIGNNNAVTCWGSDEGGQLGDGTPGDVVDNVPDPVTGLPTADEVALGGRHSCARSGTVVACWGDNTFGQLGNRSVVSSASATTIAGTWTKLATGRDHTCAIDAAGAAYCWGRNHHGQLGDGTFEMRVEPTLVDAGPWFAIAARVDHTCAVKATDRSVWCWGSNYDGQLGSGDAWSPALQLIDAEEL